MQEVFEEMCQRIATEQPDVMKILTEISTDKRNKTIKRLSESDAESLFNIIENESPLSGEEK